MSRTTKLLGLLLVLSLTSLAPGQNLLRRLQQRIDQAAGVLPGPAPVVQDTAPAVQGTAPPANAASSPGQAGFVADDHGKAEGIEILAVDKGGAAEVAGLTKGDKIVAVDGRLVKTLDDLGRALNGRRAGEELRFGVLRSGKLTEKKLKLQALASTAPPAAQPDTQPAAGNLPRPTAQRSPVLGVTVEPLTAEIRRRNNLALTKGAYISRVVQGSPAHRYQLPIGGVIVAMGDQPVNGPDDLRRVVARMPANQRIEVTYYHRNKFYRRNLVMAPAPPSNPATALVPSRGGTGRPLLDRLERVLDGVAERPQTGNDQVALLRRQVEVLQAELTRLQARVEQLEKAKTQSKPALNAPGQKKQ